MDSAPLQRTCKQCGQIIVYKHLSSFRAAEKANTLCISCGNKNKPKKPIYERMCKQCNKKLIYNRKNKFIKAEEKNSLCRSCSSKNQKGKPRKTKNIGSIPIVYMRECLQCNKQLTYKTKKRYKAAETANSLCKSCAIKNRTNTTLGGFKGKFNPFFGKKHSDETKLKLSTHNKGVKTGKNSAKASPGISNPMAGKTFYSVWEKYYGKSEADRLLVDYKIKKSLQTSGKNNPMYGKTSPQGSGNGWKGWYKNWFFRSLRELSYAISLDKQGLCWRSAESKEFRVKYVDFSGTERTYCPDFLVDEKILVEVKPIKLQKSISVQTKANAIQGLCSDRGFNYLLTDAEILSDDEIKKLHDSGQIKFTRRYENLYQKRIKSLPSLESL